MQRCAFYRRRHRAERLRREEVMSMTTLTDTPTRAAASATPTTMRAAVVKTSGAPLVVSDVPVPTPGQVKMDF